MLECFIRLNGSFVLPRAPTCPAVNTERAKLIKNRYPKERFLQRDFFQTFFIPPKALKSASFPAKARALPSRNEAQPRHWRGWASEPSQLQNLSSYLVSWLPLLVRFRTVNLTNIKSELQF